MKKNGKHQDAKGFNSNQQLMLMPPLGGMNNMIPPDNIQDGFARNIENAQYDYDLNIFVETYKLELSDLIVEGKDVTIRYSDIVKVYSFIKDDGSGEDEIIGFAKIGDSGYLVDILEKKIITTVSKISSDITNLVKWDENYLLSVGRLLFEIFKDGSNELKNIFYSLQDGWSLTDLKTPSYSHMSNILSLGSLNYAYIDNKIYYASDSYIVEFDTIGLEFNQIISGTRFGSKVLQVGNILYLVSGFDFYKINIKEKTKELAFSIPNEIGAQHSFLIRFLYYFKGFIYVFGVCGSAGSIEDGDAYPVGGLASYKIDINNNYNVTKIEDLPYVIGYASLIDFDDKIYFFIGNYGGQLGLDKFDYGTSDVMSYTPNGFYQKEQSIAYKAYGISLFKYKEELYYYGGIYYRYSYGSGSENTTTHYNKLFKYKNNEFIDIDMPPVYPITANGYNITSTSFLQVNRDGHGYLIGLTNHFDKVYRFNMPNRDEEIPIRCLIIKDGRVCVSQQDMLYYSAVGDADLWNHKDSITEDGGLFLEVGYKEKSYIKHVCICLGNLICFMENGDIYNVKGSYPDWSVIKIASGELLTTNTVTIGSDVIYGTVTGLKKLSTTSAYGDYTVNRFQNNVFDLDAIYLHVSKARNSFMFSSPKGLFELNIDLGCWYNLGKEKNNLTSFVTIKDNIHNTVMFGVKNNNLYNTEYGDIKTESSYMDNYIISFGRVLANDRILIKKIIIWGIATGNKFDKDKIIFNTHDKESPLFYKNKIINIDIEKRFAYDGNSFKIIKYQILTTEAIEPKFIIPKGIYINKITIDYVPIGMK